MRHPNDGILRRLVDEPAGVADADREHVAGCQECLSALAIVRQDAAATDAALHSEVAPDMDAAWQRLSDATADQPPRRVAKTPTASRWRAALRSPVMAVAAVVALLAGASAAAATNWLQIFHAERVAPVTAPQFELAQLPELDAFGTLEITEKVNVRRVADGAEAQQASGLAIPQIGGALPRGVTGEPVYLVGGKAAAVFTFSADKAAQFVKSAGGTPPPAPAGLDGSQFQLNVGPGVAAVWGQDRPAPTMIVARASAPTVYSSGIPFETARDYLLSLPGLPANIASQLRSFTGDGTTLPLFVPSENMTSSTADIAGKPATVLSSRQGIMAAVVWVDGGVVNAVAGSMSADEALTVARGLRWGR